jgi:N-acylneuraminate cytidylyltransferase
MSEERRLAVIPARGGSKRFPRKNVALFEGTPLVARTIDVALAAGVFHRVVVSTEDAEIAGIARTAGAELHARDPALASDRARVVDVCRAVLADEAAAGRRYDVFCVLLPTSPFRTATHVQEGLAVLHDRRANVAMSVTVFPHVPFWALRETGGFVRLQWGRRHLRSRDRLPTLYRHNGVVLWSRTDAFRRSGDFYGARVAAYHMSPEESIDVDQPIDLEFAEFLAGRQRRLSVDRRRDVVFKS